MKSKVAERMLANMPEGVEEKVDKYAEELLSKRKYRAEDIQEFYRWISANGCYYSELLNCWLNDDDEEDNRYTIEEVLKLWEEAE